MKLELLNTAAVGVAVKSGIVVDTQCFVAQLAFAAGGRGVQRGAAASHMNAPSGKPAVGGMVCYGYDGVGHLRRD